jgi:hypothetical protein
MLLNQTQVCFHKNYSLQRVPKMGWFETYIFSEPKDITAWLALLVSALSLTISYSILRREQKKQWEQSKPSFRLDFVEIAFRFSNVSKLITLPNAILPEKMRGGGWRVFVTLTIENKFDSDVKLLKVKAQRIDSRQPMFLYQNDAHFKMDEDCSEMLAICENPMYIKSKHIGSLSFYLIFPDNTITGDTIPRVRLTIYLGLLSSKGRIIKKLRFFSINNIVTQPSFIAQKEWERFENFLEKEDERQKKKE